MSITYRLNYRDRHTDREAGIEGDRDTGVTGGVVGW